MTEERQDKPACKGCKRDHTVEGICCGDHPETCHSCHTIRQNWALGFGVLLIVMLILGLILT